MKLFQGNEVYRENVEKYKKSDAVLGMVLFAVMSLEYALLAFATNRYVEIKNNITAVGCIANILMIFIVLLFLKVKKEKVQTIGLCCGNWKLSALIGCILATAFFFNNCISHLIGGAELIPLKKAGLLIVYYLTVSMCEELVFRGYIGTRLYGIIKNPVICICVNGILFIMMHFPYRMIAYGMSLSDLTVNNMGWILNLFVTHIIFTLIYQKTNSLLGAIIPHWASNLAYNLIQR